MKHPFFELIPIIKKEAIHITRDFPSLVLALLIPFIQLTIFGYAINLDVKHIRTIVCDQNMTSISREIIDSYENSGYFDIVLFAHSPKEAIEAIDSGKSKVAIIIPRDFSREKTRLHTSHLQILIDGSDPTLANQAQAFATVIGQVKSFDTITRILKRNELPIISVDSRILYNPELRSANFFVPGLLGVILQLIGILLTSFAIVRERELGTIEQLMVSPIHPSSIVLGKMIPYSIIALFDIITALAAASLIFRVKIHGSLFLLLLLSILFLLTALGIGLLVSTIAKTQLQAMFISFAATFLPSFMLSGFIFPREGMPKIIQFLGWFVPLTFYLKILRGIIIKGVTFNHIIEPTFSLTLLCIIFLTLSISRFKKYIE